MDNNCESDCAGATRSEQMEGACELECCPEREQRKPSRAASQCGPRTPQQQPQREPNERSRANSRASKSEHRSQKSVERNLGCSKTKTTPRHSRHSRKHGRHGKSETRQPHSLNPFINFFLTLYFKHPERNVIEVACQAGKLWWRLTPEQKYFFVKIAKRENAKRARLNKRGRSKHERKNRAHQIAHRRPKCIKV